MRGRRTFAWIASAAVVAASALFSCLDFGALSGGTEDGGMSVDASSSFSIQASPGQLNIAEGAQGTVTIALTRNANFSDPVTASFTGLPAGVVASPPTLIFPNGTPSIDVTLAVATTTPTGTAHVTVSGVAGALTASTAFDLLVTGAPGTLDTSFGDGGVVQTAFDTATGGQALALQPDGNIVVAGVTVTADGGGNQTAVLARYQSNGALDPAFGSGGIVTTVIGTSSVFAGVAVQGDGKILASGYGGSIASPEAIVARYGSDGKVDSTFLPVTATLPYDNNGAGIAPLSDGTVVAYANFLDAVGFAFLRYTSTGVVDSNFGSAGAAQSSLQGSFTGGPMVQSDGKIVGVGTNQNGGSFVGLARFLDDGGADPTFGVGGMVSHGLSESDAARASALQSDGKFIVVAASALQAPGGGLAPPIFGVGRFASDGTVDYNFGQSGFASVGIGTAGDYPNAVAIAQDGKIIVVGSSTGGAGDRPALVRLSSGGSRDTGFGQDGIVLRADLRGTLQGVALQPDGKIVVVGTVQLDGSPASAIWLARFWP